MPVIWSSLVFLETEINLELKLSSHNCHDSVGTLGVMSNPNLLLGWWTLRYESLMFVLWSTRICARQRWCSLPILILHHLENTQDLTPIFTQTSVGRRTYLILYLRVSPFRNKRHSPLHSLVMSIQWQGVFPSENILIYVSTLIFQYHLTVSSQMGISI